MGGPNAGDCFSEVSIVNTALSYTRPTPPPRPRRRSATPTTRRISARSPTTIKGAFNARFLNAAGDAYGSGRQTTSILPLAFGMVPAANLQAVGDRLVQNILVDNGGHLDTGIFGTRYIVDALASIGRIDVAMTVLGQESYPGFGFELAHGATTPWEQWTYAAGMLTHDHAMFGGINTSLYTQLAGITPASPGYRTVRIAPQVPSSLDHAAASIDTVRGTVASAWTKSADSLRLEVTIPPNATATVRVPLGPGQGVSTPEGAERIGDGVFAVGSGQWTFITGRTAVDVPGTVGGSVPPTLSLALGAPASFGPFTPGVAKDYTASTTATVTSTAGDATLTSSDPGHLANGSFTLPSPLQVAFSKSTWNAPVSNDAVDDRVHAAHRRHRRAAHRELQQDAHVHAVDDGAVASRPGERPRGPQDRRGRAGHASTLSMS